MKIYESKLTVFLKEDTSYANIHNMLSKNVNKALYHDETLSILHKNLEFKPYCYSSLYPYDTQSKIYRKEQIYMLNIRSLDYEFLKNLNASFKKNKFDFKVLATQIQEFKLDVVEFAVTQTPSVISIIDKKTNKALCYTKEFENLEFVKNRIKDNLEKKYMQFFKENVKAPEDFINFIKMTNQKPIIFNYKNTKILANKFDIAFNSDEISQMLAKLAFAVGLLEKNSLGFGFLARKKYDL